jgi:hypothetical protein
MIISNFVRIIEAAISTLQDRRKRVMVVALGLGNITACNVTGPYNNPPNSSSVQLTSLVITDTSNTIESPAILNPTENNGSFTLNWRQSGTYSYSTAAYLSLYSLPSTPGNVAPGAKDILLFSIDVMDPSATYGSNGNPKSTRTCTYAADNTIDCGTKVDISTILTTLPKSAYVVLQACSNWDRGCTNTSYPVTLK